MRLLMALFLYLAPAMALADVKVAERDVDDLEKFEAWRAETCVETQLDWERSSKNTRNKKVQEIADRLEAWCPMDGSVMYLTAPAAEACEKDKGALTEICRKLGKYQADSEAREKVFFTPAFDELMLFTQDVPWKTVVKENEIADKMGVTAVQRGNLSLEITAGLIALNTDDYSKAEVATFMGYLDSLDLTLSRGGVFFVPFMGIRLYALGVTDKTVYLDIASVMDDEGRNPINLASEDERIGGDEAFNYYLPLSAGNVAHFTKSHAIRVTGYGNRKKTEPLYEFTVPLENFRPVMDELVAHYRTLQDAD